MLGGEEDRGTNREQCSEIAEAQCMDRDTGACNRGCHRAQGRLGTATNTGDDEWKNLCSALYWCACITSLSAVHVLCSYVDYIEICCLYLKMRMDDFAVSSNSSVCLDMTSSPAVLTMRMSTGSSSFTICGVGSRMPDFKKGCSKALRMLILKLVKHRANCLIDSCGYWDYIS